MKESSTYQAILEEGRAKGRAEGQAKVVAVMRGVVRVLGERLFGPPDAKTVAAIEALVDFAQFKSVRLRVPSAKNWQELLGEAALSLRRKRRRPSRRGANPAFAGTLPEMHIRTAERRCRSWYNPTR
jgi:hypothetical protein